MAHLAHALPWTTLSTTLPATKHGPRGTPDRITVLTPSATLAALAQRRHFVRAFVRTLAAFSAAERRKYPADPLLAASDPDDPAIFAATTESALEKHLASPHARARLDQLSPRRAEARAEGWAVLGGYADARAEVVMAMVATGEVLPLLRLARWRAPSPSTGEEGEEVRRERRSQLMGLWSYPGANPGWSNVVIAALEAYLFLNVVFLREELWMVYEGEGEEGKGRGFQRDYRDDGAFRSMLSNCTRYQDGCTWGIPHREFFGGSFSYGGRTHAGREALKAEFDPLHPAKMERLREYLRMCWDHLVRVHMVLGEAGETHDWEHEVEWAIHGLWGMSK